MNTVFRQIRFPLILFLCLSLAFPPELVAQSLAADGKRTSVTELNGTVINWTYDALNRLVTEDYNAPGDANDFEHTYVYDLVGNRLKKQVDGEPDTIYSYNDADQLTQETTDGNTITYSYNYNGSLIEEANDVETIRQYAYSLHNRLASVTSGGVTTAYKYNPDGIRIQKQVGAANPVKYLIDPYNETGYSQVFKEIQAGSSDVTYIIGSDVLAQATGTNNPEYFLYDGHGSVRQLADNTGALIAGQQFNFDAYGNLINTVIPQASLLYTGEMWDSDLGALNLRTRDYRPDIGIFMTQDTYSGNNEDPPSLHKYLYAFCDPINNIDPSGEFSLSEINVTAAIQATMMAMNVTGAVYHAKGLGVSVVGLWNAWAMGDFWGGLPHVVMGAIHGGGLAMNIAGMIGSMTPPPSASMSALVLSGGGAAATERFWTVVISNPQLAGWVIKSIAPPAFSAYIVFMSRSGGGSAESHHKVPPGNKKYAHENHPLVKKAGWTKKDIERNPRNQLLLDNHHGRHVDSYHESVNEILNKGLRRVGKGGRSEAERELLKALDEIERQIIDGTLKPYKSKDVYVP